MGERKKKCFKDKNQAPYNVDACDARDSLHPVHGYLESIRVK
jgi:hypothetical protein